MGRRILVVDDHAPTRKTIRAMLEADKENPVTVVEAGSGLECLVAVEKGSPPDLILLDVAMPDMDGFEACRLLRSKGNQMPIVFVTGKGELADYQAGREAGGDSYLTKPVARGMLRSLVNLFTGPGRKKS
jgi:CheY-like chemotaxis protein